MGDLPDVWHFGRRSKFPSIVELPARWWRVVSDDVDFDARWNDLVRKPELAHLKLPRAEELVELQAAIRCGLLAVRVAALVARPNVGKTVGVLRLAHLRMLAQAPGAELVAMFDTQDSVNALGLAAKVTADDRRRR